MSFEGKFSGSMANLTEAKEGCTREIQVQVPAEIVARETESIVRKYQKLARLPGFRRGKVPAGVIRQRFAENVNSEVAEALIPRYFREEAARQGLTPVSQPRVTQLHLQEGEPLRFTATFEILPEIAVSGYQELRAPRPQVSVAESEVEEALENLRQQHATYTALEEDHPLADGDFAQVSFQGTPRETGGKSPQQAKNGLVGGPGKPIHVDDVLVEVGGANTVPEFSQNLRGARPGDQPAFDVAYPADFSDARLAGRTFSYAVQVKAIKRKTVPQLDDDFAKQVGEFADLATLRQRLRERMAAEKRLAAEHEAKEKLLDELIGRNDFAVPEALVERQVEVRLDRGLRALAAQGMRPEDMKKMDLPRLRAAQRQAALREVKASLLLEKIADQEKIEVSDAELNQAIEELAAQRGQTSEAIRGGLTREGALDRIRNRIRSQKALDFLYERSA